MDDSQSIDGPRSTAEYLSALRRRWWIVALGLLIGALGGLVLSLVQTKIYESNTSVLVQETGAPNPTQLANSRTTGINLDTEAQLVTSQVVATEAQKLLKTSTPVSDLQAEVSVTVPPNTEVLTITFQGATPKDAQSGSHAFAQAYLDQRAAHAKKDIDTQVEALRAQSTALNKALAAVSGQIASLPTNSVDRATAVSNQGILSNQIQDIGNKLSPLLATSVTPGAIISDADLPTTPTSPNLLLDLASGIFAGLLLGIAVALLAERADNRLHDGAAVRRLTDLPVLVDVPRRQFRGEVVPRAAENFHHFGRLRNAVLSELGKSAAVSGGGSDRHSRVVLVLGAAPGNAPGVVAANLCASLARPEHPVTLLCADPESSSPALLGVSDRRGLSELLRFECDIGEIQHRSPVCPDVYVVVPGTGPQADEDLVPERLGQVVDALLAYSNYLIIETRPARIAADGQALAPLAGMSFVVLELLRSERADLIEVIHEFEQVGAPLTGVVMVPHVKSVRTAKPAGGGGQGMGQVSTARPRVAAPRPGSGTTERAGVTPAPRGPTPRA